MKNFIVHDKQGNILRTGLCQDIDFKHQAREGEFIIEGLANDVIQKIVNGQVVDRTREEIKADNPPTPEIPFEKQSAHITNDQWQNVLSRLKNLE